MNNIFLLLISLCFIMVMALPDTRAQDNSMEGSSDRVGTSSPRESKPMQAAPRSDQSGSSQRGSRNTDMANSPPDTEKPREKTYSERYRERYNSDSYSEDYKERFEPENYRNDPLRDNNRHERHSFGFYNDDDEYRPDQEDLLKPGEAKKVFGEDDKENQKQDQQKELIPQERKPRRYFNPVFLQSLLQAPTNLNKYERQLNNLNRPLKVEDQQDPIPADIKPEVAPGSMTQSNNETQQPSGPQRLEDIVWMDNSDDGLKSPREMLYQEGFDAIASRRYSQAARTFSQLQSLDRDSKTLAYALGLSLYLKRDYADAARQIKQAQSSFPNSPKWFHDALNTRDLKSQQFHLQQYVERNPDDEQAKGLLSLLQD